MFIRHKKTDKRIKYSLFSPTRFIRVFCLIAFVVTVTFFLFLHSNSRLGVIIIPRETLPFRATATLMNVVFLSTVLSIIDNIRRKILFGKPLENILHATREIMNGNFKVRIAPLHKYKFKNEFDIIIEDFNKMAEELEGNHAMKNDFISSVSHEFKTPLSVIHNYATMLQDPTLEEEQRLEYTQHLSKSAMALSDMISNILRLNKLENQQIFSEKKSFNLSEQLCECMLLFENSFEKKNIDINLSLDEELMIKADYELLYIVWNNLFSNAVKFNNENGSIKITLTKENDYAIVSVADSGCGMNSETQEHIFEKFFQGDCSHSGEGNGLGLSLVARIMDIVNGKIHVESTVDKGSTFTVSLPLE